MPFEWRTLEPWIPAAAAVVVALAIGLLARAFVFPRIVKLASKSTTELDDLFLRSIHAHVPLWFVLGGLVVALHLAPVEARWTVLTIRIAAALFFFSLSLAVARFATDAFTREARRRGSAVGTTSLIQNVVRASVLLVGALLVLANLGVAITPLLTALGVGTLAVALALQPTLTNLIAGIYIATSRPVRVGDLVELEGGTRGVVLDIGWRVTRLQTPTSSIVAVPNSKLADMMVTNYELPEPEVVCPVEAMVSHDADLDQVEQLANDVAKDVMEKTPGAVKGFVPVTRFHTFGVTSVGFTVVLRAKHFNDQGLLKHELIKSLKRRFAESGLEVQSPQRWARATASAPAVPGRDSAPSATDGAASRNA